MSRTVRLAAYAAILGLMFGGGAALGAAIGPEPSPERTITGEHDSSTDAPAHESEH